jgi:hypothetical protein
VAETTVKIFLCCGFRRDGTSVSMLVEDMSRFEYHKFYVCDLFTDCPSYSSVYIRPCVLSLAPCHARSGLA